MSLKLEKHLLERIYHHGISDNGSALRWSSTLMTGGLAFMGLFQLSAGQELLLSLAVGVLFGAFMFWLSGPKDPLRNGDPYVQFQQNALHLRMLCDNQPIWQEKLSRKEIASVAPYQQQGWFFSRDRGVVVEHNDGQQWRLALKLSKEELEAYSKTLNDTLEPLGYPITALRRFQP